MKQIAFYSLLSILFLILFSLLFSCNDEDTEDVSETDTLETEQTIFADTIKFLWESNPDFQTPESVKYDKDRDVLYIANINGNPTDLDENGFISKLSTSGEIIELQWVTGLSAPKGMGILDDHLYVTDINRLVKISIDSGKIVNDWPVEAEFLNDIDIDKNGTVFVSDMRSDRIFALINDTFDVWLQSDHFDRPNGLFVDNNNLLVGTNDTIYSVFIETKEINPFLEGTGGIDGLESVKNDQFVFSDWSGHIHLSSPGKDLKLILNTAKDTVQAADIEYSSMKDLILVPTFFHNTVSAYELIRK
jgi:DNA-binding beta-propeller fold protein YncE